MQPQHQPLPVTGSLCHAHNLKVYHPNAPFSQLPSGGYSSLAGTFPPPLLPESICPPNPNAWNMFRSSVLSNQGNTVTPSSFFRPSSDKKANGRGQQAYPSAQANRSSGQPSTTIEALDVKVPKPSAYGLHYDLASVMNAYKQHKQQQQQMNSCTFDAVVPLHLRPPELPLAEIRAANPDYFMPCPSPNNLFPHPLTSPSASSPIQSFAFASAIGRTPITSLNKNNNMAQHLNRNVQKEGLNQPQAQAPSQLQQQQQQASAITARKMSLVAEPPCSHSKSWKCLRVKLGVRHMLCLECHARWRILKETGMESQQQQHDNNRCIKQPLPTPTTAQQEAFARMASDLMGVPYPCFMPSPMNPPAEYPTISAKDDRTIFNDKTEYLKDCGSSQDEEEEDFCPNPEDLLSSILENTQIDDFPIEIPT